MYFSLAASFLVEDITFLLVVGTGLAGGGDRTISIPAVVAAVVIAITVVASSCLRLLVLLLSQIVTLPSAVVDSSASRAR